MEIRWSSRLGMAFAATCAFALSACTQSYDTTVVCWEEPVGPVRTSGVSSDRHLAKHAPEMRVVCAPIHARPAGKQIIYSGPGDSAPGGKPPGSHVPPAPPPPPAPPKTNVAAFVEEDVTAALDGQAFAIVQHDPVTGTSNVIAGDENGVTNLNEIVSNLRGD